MNERKVVGRKGPYPSLLLDYEVLESSLAVTTTSILAKDILRGNI